MALPSKRRPVEIEEDIREQFEEHRIQPLKIKLSRAQIFSSHMAAWYQKLGKKKRRTITAKALKRQAVEVCHILNYKYDHLPLDWVSKLKEECGLLIYPDKKAKKRRKEAAYVPPIPSDSVSRFPRAVKRTALERLSAQLGVGPKKEIDESSASPSGLPAKADVDKPKFKKIIDLSNDKPPKYWSAAYAKGLVLPRRLTVFPTENSVIVYYDYSPQLQENDGSGRLIKLKPQPRVNTDVLFSNDQQ